MGLWRKFKKIGSKCARVITDPLTHQARKKVEDNYHRNLAQCEAAHQDALIQANAEYQNQCKQIQDRLQALESVKHEQEQKYLEERECLRQYLAKKQKVFQETKERIETLFVVLEASIYASALGELEPIQMALEVFKHSAFFRNHFMALELLHIAAQNNQIAILKLLAKVMDIHHKNEAGNTPLEIARASNETCGVLEAISLETEIFWKAVYLEDFQAMQHSLTEGAAINATLPQGYNILEQMIIDKKPYVLIRHLIEAGAYSQVPNLSEESAGLPLALELSISHPDWKVRNLLEEFWEIDADITNREWISPEGNPNLRIQNCLKAPAKHFYQSELEQCSTVFTQGGRIRFFGASTLGIIEYDVLKAQWSHVFFYNLLCFDDRYPSLPKHLPPLIEPIWQQAFAQEPIQFHYLKTKDNQEQLVLLSRTKTKTRLIKIWLYNAKSNNCTKRELLAPAKAEIHDTEIRKTKTKVYKVDSKPKPKAPAKLLSHNRQPQRDYEPEPKEAYEATPSFRANVLETLKTTRGGLRHHPSLEPLTQPQESQPLLWQQTTKQSTANTRNQRVNAHAENNNARKPIYSVNSNPILDFFFPPANADECSLPMFETFSDVAITKRKISFKEINLPSDDLLYAPEETWNKVMERNNSLGFVEKFGRSSIEACAYLARKKDDFFEENPRLKIVGQLFIEASSALSDIVTEKAVKYAGLEKEMYMAKTNMSEKIGHDMKRLSTMYAAKCDDLKISKEDQAGAASIVMFFLATTKVSRKALKFKHQVQKAGSHNSTSQAIDAVTPHNDIVPRIDFSSTAAHNVNAQSTLNKKLRALQAAQKEAVKIENLPDGRIRYYDVERPARKPGPTRGASFVTEYNPKTGQVRQWNESYDQFGNVNRVHPKTIDGQDVRSQHYPLTKSELEDIATKKSLEVK